MNTCVRRSQLAVHPRLAGQKTRIAVQSARRAGVPLYPAQQYT
jgi:hypothetical protein